MKHAMIIAMLGLLVLSRTMVHAQPEINRVGEDEDYATIQEAIDDLSGTATLSIVLIDDGTYNENITISDFSNSVVLKSESGNAGDCIISGDTDSDGTGDGTVVTATDVGNLFLDRITIREGLNLLAGGVSVEDGSLVVEFCVLEQNSGGDGGAIVVENGSLTVEDSCFIDNTSTTNDSGSAIYVVNDGAALVTIDACDFTDNDGSHAVNILGDVGGSIQGSLFHNNTGASVNVSFSPDDGSRLLVSGCDFTADEFIPPPNGGVGAISATTTLGTLDVVDCTFSDLPLGVAFQDITGSVENTVIADSSSSGASLVVSESTSGTVVTAEDLQVIRCDTAIELVSGDLTIDTTLIADNNVGVEQSGGTLALRSCTVTENEDSGLSIDLGATASAINSIFWENTIEDDGTFTSSYCLVTSIFEFPGIGNIAANPKFLDPVNERYFLQPDSPARNEALNGTDLGAFQFEDYPVFVRGDTTGNGVLSIADASLLLTWMFQSGPAPSCQKTADADDSGSINGIADSTYILTYVAGNGPAPPSPFPDCDVETTVESITCDDYTCI